MHAFIEKQEIINTQLAQSMTGFKDTIAKLTSALSFQENDKFPSQPQQNPCKSIKGEVARLRSARTSVEHQMERECLYSLLWEHCLFSSN